MADKTEKAVDLGILEEDDEFEEFPAEDWKEVTDTDPKNVSLIFIKLSFVTKYTRTPSGSAIGKTKITLTISIIS